MATLKKFIVGAILFCVSLQICSAFPSDLRSRLMPRRDTNLNPRPVIGIVTQPLYEDLKDWAPDADQYLNAGYMKWVQSAGGIAIPIPHTATNDQLRKLFSLINGIIFPGGGTELFDNRYREALDVLYDEAVKFNLKNNANSQSFPLWGTCLGFQYLAIRGNDGARDTLGDYLAQNVSLPVNYTSKLETSRLMSRLDRAELPLFLEHLQKHPSTANVHYHGIPPSLFQTSPSMGSKFSMLGTSIGQDGKEFVAMMESRQFPFFGVQFHPERSIFEWATKENIDKHMMTIRLQHYFGTAFVMEARQNQNAFPSRKVENAWNLNIFTPKMIFGSSFLEEEDQNFFVFAHKDFPFDTLKSIEV